MNTNIPLYSLSDVTRDKTSSIFVLDLQGKVEHMPAIFLQAHRKDYYVLMFVQQGSSRHWVDMVPYTLRANTLYFSTPNQVYMQEEPQPLNGKIISFTRDFLLTESSLSIMELPIIKNSLDAHELSLDEEQASYINALIMDLLHEFRGRRAWHETMLHAKLKVLLLYLSRLYMQQFEVADTSKDRVLLHQFRGLINQNCSRIHDVATYAEKLNISPGHLGKIIRNQTGKSTIDHIHERLGLEAKRMLFHTEQTMKEIAFELGFEDASYFNRFFKKLTGKTPLVYRNETRAQFQ